MALFIPELTLAFPNLLNIIRESLSTIDVDMTNVADPELIVEMPAHWFDAEPALVVKGALSKPLNICVAVCLPDMLSPFG